MNPFDLRGPEFLFSYCALLVVVFVAFVGYCRLFEGGPVPKLPSVDPYLVAYLRGGEIEALRVSVLSLLDRGLLKSQDSRLITTPEGLIVKRRPLERHILQRFVAAQLATDVFEDRGACGALREELKSLGLLVNGAQQRIRFLLGLGGAIGLWWVAFHKLQLAAERGHHNIGFLLLLGIFGPFFAAAPLFRRRTARGDRFLEDLSILLPA